MARTFGRNTVTVALPLEVDDSEIRVEVDCDLPPYCPATGPTYSCGGQPEEGGSVEDFAVFEVRGNERIRREDLDRQFTCAEMDELCAEQADSCEPEDAFEERRFAFAQ